MYKRMTTEAYETLATQVGGEYYYGRIIRDGQVIGVVYEGDMIAMRDGNIYRYNGRRWRPAGLKPTSSGYPQIKVNGRNVSAHRIIATCFCAQPVGHVCVNHINGNKLDNRAENLEWVTYSANMIHAYAELGHPRLGRRPLNA